jgi:hypothetical protein
MMESLVPVGCFIRGSNTLFHMSIDKWSAIESGSAIVKMCEERVPHL